MTSGSGKESVNHNGKRFGDMTDDGVLAYGVTIGRFVFAPEGYTVFVISDLAHIGPSDVLMLYQITKEDYLKLLPLAGKHQIRTRRSLRRSPMPAGGNSCAGNPRTVKETAAHWLMPICPWRKRINTGNPGQIRCGTCR